MTTADRAIQHISDTARWAAVYRARETERLDAIFRDPFARRLAGERGEEIAKALPFHEKNSWSWVTRTYVFDSFIRGQVDQGVDMVVNLAAGLDARPYRMDLPASLQWIEVDLPDIVSYKEEILEKEKPHCRLEGVSLDLSDEQSRRDLFGEVNSRATKVAVAAEGLLMYFTPEEVASLAKDLAAGQRFQNWVIDLASPGQLRLMQRTTGKQLSEA